MRMWCVVRGSWVVRRGCECRVRGCWASGIWAWAGAWAGQLKFLKSQISNGDARRSYLIWAMSEDRNTQCRPWGRFYSTFLRVRPPHTQNYMCLECIGASRYFLITQPPPFPFLRGHFHFFLYPPIPMAGLGNNLVQGFATSLRLHWEFLRLWTGFCVFGPAFSSPAHGLTSLAMD
jgi:hypothetical protein